MSQYKIKFYNFPINLINAIKERWTTMVMGEYSPPPLPSDHQLRSLLEIAYLASMEREETRGLKFTICCTLHSQNSIADFNRRKIKVWKFSEVRLFNLQELKRLAIVSNLENSAIWVNFTVNPDEVLTIKGLLNYGFIWSQTRKSLSYQSELLPHALIIRIEGPGEIKINQGQYLVATLKGGKIIVEPPTSHINLLGAGKLFHEGLILLEKQIQRPKFEHIKEWSEFEYVSYVNTILAIINAIEQKGHGGALIFASQNCDFIRNKDTTIQIKYKLEIEKNHLKEDFLKFINTRHKYADLFWLKELGKEVNEIDILKLEKKYEEKVNRLIETCKFISNLAETDGAVIMRTDLKIEGFGIEILLDKVDQSKVYLIKDILKKKKEEYNTEQRGTRHRSAMRLCSTFSDIVIFVVSQDGGVSIVWKNENAEVCFIPNLNTTNVNMVIS